MNEDTLPLLPVDDTTAFNSDFDAVLSAETAAAKAKPVADFPGASSTTSETIEPVASGDDALVAAVQATPAESAEPVAAAVAEPVAATAPAAPAEPVKPAEAAAPAPAKATYDPAESFGLADGINLTREQIIGGLRERNAFGADAQKFAEVFRCTPQQAEQYWKPYVDAIVADPNKGDWVDAQLAVYDDAGKREYIRKAMDFYDQYAAENGLRPQQPAAIPPEVKRELDESRRFREETTRAQQQQSVQSAQQAIAQERATLLAASPQLADERLMQLVAQRTFAVLQQQQQNGVPQTYRLADAARDMKDVIERWGAPAQAAPPTTAPVPALNGASGATATGAKRAGIDMKPQRYATPDEALADWDANVAPALGFK